MSTLYCGRCRRTWAAGTMRSCPHDGTSLVPLALAREGRAVDPALGPPPRLRPIAEVAKRYPTAAWLPAPWRRLLGTGVPAAGCAVLLYGPPGSGKSTVAVALLAQAAMAGREAAWLDAEMQEGPAMVSIVNAARVPAQARRRLLSAAVRGVSHVDDLLADGGVAVACIDSVQALGVEVGDAARWRERVGFLLLLAHVTADGRVRGGTELSHEVDAVVEMLPCRGARTAKSRFGAPPGSEVDFADLLYQEPAGRDLESSNVVAIGG